MLRNRLHSSENLANFVAYMIGKMNKYILTLIAACALLPMRAQSLVSHHFEERSLSLGGGYTNMLDTYLSPLHYEGAHVTLVSECFSQTEAPSRRWYAQSLFALHGDYTTPRSGNGLTVGGMADYSYSQYYCFSFGGDKRRAFLYVGPQTQLRIGGIYNLRNSNNPAQLKLGVNLAASAIAKYGFSLWDIPMKVRLQTDLPLLGTAFAPDYGQSYYEIFYLGQSGGCVHMTSLHNNLSLRTNLSCDIELRPCTLRFTLGNDLYQWWLGNQHYRMFTHSVMLGYVRNLYRIVRDDKVRPYVPY